MPFTAHSTIGTVLPGQQRAVGEFMRYNVRTLADLRHLPLAEWWRIARGNLHAVVRAAIEASVRPRDASLQDLSAVLTTSLTASLGRRGFPEIASILRGHGITSLLLVARLTRRDVLSLRGIDLDELDIIVSHLGRHGIRLTKPS